MQIRREDVHVLVEYCSEHLGPKESWIEPDGYPDSLALCIIDSIYSTGSNYQSVVNVINKYKTDLGSRDSASDLLAAIRQAGGPEEWASNVVCNSKPAHTRKGAPLKASVIYEAAQMLLRNRIDTVQDLVDFLKDDEQKASLQRQWKGLPSQRSGITYNYFILLAGQPSVKPDRMILRFLQKALGLPKAPNSGEASELVAAAAHVLDVSPRTLDHTIWRTESGRASNSASLGLATAPTEDSPTPPNKPQKP